MAASGNVSKSHVACCGCSSTVASKLEAPAEFALHWGTCCMHVLTQSACNVCLWSVVLCVCFNFSHFEVNTHESSRKYIAVSSYVTTQMPWDANSQ
jgi:hypothetical protein